MVTCIFDNPLMSRLNFACMVDLLKAVGDVSKVGLEFKDAQTAGQVRPIDDYKYRYILMPMRI
jgi:DNA polymerase-3 subunit beta